MPRHTLMTDEIPAEPGGRLRISGDEARHAVRVKRLHPGDAVRLLDGRGGVATASVVEAARTLVLDVVHAGRAAPPAPAIHVFGATPKGPRLDKMIDMLSQAGAASWRPLSTKLGVVDPGAGKAARMARICTESAKQCGRPWLMRIGERAAFDEALDAADAGALLVADPLGDPPDAAIPPGVQQVRIIVGPEGGLHDSEREAAAAAGASFMRLGPHELRIETAAVVGVGAVMALRGPIRDA